MAKKTINSLRMPVYRESGFDLHDAETAAAAFANEANSPREPENYIYSRYRNPTVVAAEEAVMRTEGCKWALLTQTGMSAVDTALSVFQKGNETGPWLFFNEIYGGTISFVENVLRGRRGIEAHYFSPEEGQYNIDNLEATIKRLRPDVLYVETVSNPMLLVADVTNVTKAAHRHGVKVIVDNTFATPWLYRPLDKGADLVIHSATKYFSGHGNLTAGVICGNDDKLLKAAIEYRKFTGHMISPDDAYRLQTQLMTFSLRFERQCSNAARLASLLSESAKVEKVFFPGLPGHTTHGTAKELFDGKGYGAMLTFDMAGSDKEIKRKRRDSFIECVREKIKLVPTLGDPETILLPVESVWGTKYPEPGMIRMSAGFEEYDDLAAVIDAALLKI